MKSLWDELWSAEKDYHVKTKTVVEHTWKIEDGEDPPSHSADLFLDSDEEEYSEEEGVDKQEEIQ